MAVSVPSLNTPPASEAAELESKVQKVSEQTPELYIAPPELPVDPEPPMELSVKVQLVAVSVPEPML